MPRKRIADKRRFERLSHDQYLELLIGPRSDQRDMCAFASEQDARAAWRLHGEQILSDLGDSSTKEPWALRHFGRPAATGVSHGQNGKPNEEQAGASPA